MVTLELWNTGTLEHWNSGTLELWNHPLKIAISFKNPAGTL